MTSHALRILVVDDSAEDYETVVEAAESSGVALRLTRAVDAESAIGLLSTAAGASPPLPGRESRLPYEYVLLDLNLPRMSGLQLLERVRADRSLSGLPVVVLTTTDSDRERSACFAAGANAFHVKPVAYASFRDTVRTLLDYWTGQTTWRAPYGGGRDAGGGGAKPVEGAGRP